MKFTKKLINNKVFLLLLLAFLLLSFRLSKPFIGNHDWNGVFFGNVAKNTAKFGFLKTKFGAVNSFLPQDFSEFGFYTHYPPIFHLLLGLEAKLIDVQEWSMRLMAAFFSLLALYFFFKLSKLLFNEKIAFASSLFFIFTPMFLYFGKMPVHEVFGLALIIYSFYCYFIYFKSSDRKSFFHLVLSLIFACQTVWSGYYLAPLFIFHYLFTKNAKKRVKKKIYWLILIPILSFFSHFLHIFILTGSWNNGLFSTMLFRMQIGKRAARYSFTLLEYVKKETLWLTVYFTKTLCFLVFIYILVLAKKIIKKKIDWRDGFLILFLIFPFIDPIIFRNVCFIHDYKLYYFLLFLPLFGALGLFYLKTKLEFLWRRNRTLSLILFILIFIFFIMEKAKFTKTLLNSSMSKPAYDLGQTLQKKSHSEEIILLGSHSFAEFSELFLHFYGQRKITYFKPNLKEFNKAYSSKTKLVVFVKDREKPSFELINFLEDKYFHWQEDQFIFFDLIENQL